MSTTVIRAPNNGRTIVFIHGLFSNSTGAWRNPNGTYWPDIVKDDASFEGWGIVCFEYDASFGSGDYSLSDVEGALEHELAANGVLKGKEILFVGHSMGGILARHFTVSRQMDLLQKNITVGLFLVASPSLGSHYANYFRLMVGLHDTQIDSLRLSGSNTWLNDLDKQFYRIKELGQIKIYGRELTEANPPVLRGFLPWSKIVPQYSAARNFPDPLTVPKSNHISIAKPDSAAAIQHQALVRLITARGAPHSTKVETSLKSTEGPAEASLTGGTADLMDNGVFRAVIAAEKNGIDSLPDPDCPVSELYEVANRLSQGRYWERATAHWLVARHGRGLEVFKHATEVAKSERRAVSQGHLAWLMSVPKDAFPYSEIKNISESARCSSVDKTRMFLGMLGHAGRDSELPIMDWEDEYDLSKLSYDYLTAVAASMSRSKKTDDIKYSVWRAIRCARARGDEEYHFFDHLKFFGWMPPSHAPVILETMISEAAPKQMLLGFLANLSSQPNPKVIGDLLVLARGSDEEISRAATMALVWTPSSDRQKNEIDGFLIDGSAAKYVSDGLNPASIPDGDALSELLENEVGMCAAWAFANRALAEPALAKEIPSLVSDLSDLRAAILLAALARTDPRSAEPLIDERLSYSLGIEEFLLRVAQTYISGPTGMFKMLSDTDEHTLYPPFLIEVLKRVYRDALETALVTTPGLAEIKQRALW